MGLYIIKTSSDMVGSYPLVSLSFDGPFGDLGSYLFGDHLGRLSSSYNLMERGTCINKHTATCSNQKI
jgi:hypothetical protein